MVDGVNKENSLRRVCLVGNLFGACGSCKYPVISKCFDSVLIGANSYAREERFLCNRWEKGKRIEAPT
jgi:hypothetical protein